MAIDLTPIPDVTLYAGAPLHIALDGHTTAGETLTYTVSTSNTLLSANVLEGNRSLKMSVEGFGDMIFELFEQEAPRTTARIRELAQSGFYDGLTFHRVIRDFMIQGGDPLGNGTGGSGIKFDDEFHPALQHTSKGVLSMAKSADDTNDSQFFITSGATRHLDFNHSVFGFLTEGEQVRQAIASVPVNGSTPVNDVVIDSVSVFVDQENGLLRLSAPEGTVGNTKVTITATDVSGNRVTREFTVYVRQDPTDNYPFLQTINPIHTMVNTPASFTLPGTDVEGDPMIFGGRVLSEDPNLSVSVNEKTGAVTITPKGVPGVYGVEFYVRAENPADYFQGRDVWDLQAVPVYVKPGKPVVELLASCDTGPSNHDGITSFNNAADKRLQFRVSNVVAGAQVQIYAGGQVIGEATVGSGTSEIVIAADAAHVLNDGQHTITVVQKVNDVTADIGNRHITTDLTSPTSDALLLTVDTTQPQITSAAVLQALEGRRYEYDVESNEESGGAITYALVEAPAGMIISDPQNGRIVWTPGRGQDGPHAVVIRAADQAGNAVEQSFQISVLPAAHILPIGRQAIDEGMPLTIELTTDATADMLPLTFRLSDAPEGATIDPQTGTFRWMPSEAQGPGEYEITVEVTNKAGARSSETFEVAVAEVNQAPTLAEIVDRAVAEGELLEFDALAQDSDLPANALTFSLLGAPEGARIDATTGHFRWRPGEVHGGQEYTMTVRVTDAAGALAERTFTVRVDEVNDPPRIDPIELPVATPGETLEFDVRAWDPDVPSRAVRFSLEPDAPEGAAIDPQTGHFSWTVPETIATDTVAFGIRVTEVAPEGHEALSVVQTVTLRVVDFRLGLLDVVLSELSAKRTTRTEPDAAQALLHAMIIGAPSAAEIPAPPSTTLGQPEAAPTGNLFDRGGLLGSWIGPDTGSGGLSALQPQEDRKDDRSKRQPNDAQPERTETVPAEQEKDQPEDETPPPSRPKTSEHVPPEAHDLVVEALVEEAQSLLLTEPEPPSAPQAEVPVTSVVFVGDAAEAPAEEVEAVPAR